MPILVAQIFFFEIDFELKFIRVYLHPQNRTGDLVAQLVEQYTFNVWALGSSPSGITKKNLTKVGFFVFY